MKLSTQSRIALSALTLILSVGTLSGAAPAVPGAHPAAARSRDVIVILRDQLPNMPAIRGARAARAAA